MTSLQYKSDLNFNRVLSLDSVSPWLVIKPEYAWLAVFILGLFFAIASLVLSYHWNRFMIEKVVLAKASLIYFLVSVVLIVAMIISLTIYLNSL